MRASRVDAWGSHCTFCSRQQAASGNRQRKRTCDPHRSIRCLCDGCATPMSPPTGVLGVAAADLPQGGCRKGARANPLQPPPVILSEAQRSRRIFPFPSRTPSVSTPPPCPIPSKRTRPSFGRRVLFDYFSPASFTRCRCTSSSSVRPAAGKKHRISPSWITR